MILVETSSSNPVAVSAGGGILVWTGTGVAPYVGPLDSVASQMGVCYCAPQRLLSSYKGNAATIRRASDNTELAVPFDPVTGLPVTGTFLNSTTGYFATLNDQKSVLDLAQSTSSLQPQWISGLQKYTVNTGQLLSGALTWSQMFGLTQTEIWAVVNPTNDANDALCQWTDGGNGGCWCPFGDQNIYFDLPDSASGRISVGAPGGFGTGTHVVRLIMNGTNRQIQVDGTTLTGGTVVAAALVLATTSTFLLGNLGQTGNIGIKAWLTFKDNLSAGDAATVLAVLSAL